MSHFVTDIAFLLGRSSFCCLACECPLYYYPAGIESSWLQILYGRMVECCSHYLPGARQNEAGTPEPNFADHVMIVGWRYPATLHRLHPHRKLSTVPQPAQIKAAGEPQVMYKFW